MLLKKIALHFSHLLSGMRIIRVGVRGEVVRLNIVRRVTTLTVHPTPTLAMFRFFNLEQLLICPLA